MDAADDLDRGRDAFDRQAWAEAFACLSAAGRHARLELADLDLLATAAEIDLSTLAADRLRRFLDAFQIEIHYNVQTRRATIRAEISGQMVDQLVQLISRAGQTTTAREPSLTSRADENGPAASSGSNQLIMHSLGECPRRVPSNMEMDPSPMAATWWSSAEVGP